jgi:hypothetical protein
MLRGRLIVGLTLLGVAAVLAAPAGAAPAAKHPIVVVTLKVVDPSAFQSGVLAARKTVTHRPLAATTQRGTLPFTGLPVSFLVLVGGTLLGGGLLLRRTARL